MNYCTNYCDSKQLLQRHPLRNPPLLRTPKDGSSLGRLSRKGRQRDAYVFCALLCFFFAAQKRFHEFTPNVWEEKKSSPQKTGQGSNPSRILQNLWGSAGKFCEIFCIVENLLKNPRAELPLKALQNFGAQPSFSDPANSSPDISRWGHPECRIKCPCTRLAI